MGVLDALLFPTGGVFFKGRTPQREGVHPALVHNNYLIGKAAKLQRFRDHGLWLLDQGRSEGRSEGRGLVDGHPVLCATPVARRVGEDVVRDDVARDDADGITFLGEAVARRSLLNADPGEGNVLLLHPCRPGQRLIVTISLGHRPWFAPAVLPRLKHRAARSGADLLLVRRLDSCSRAGVDANGCAKMAKLRAAHAALGPRGVGVDTGTLGGYAAAAIVDDTLLVRRDAPCFFDRTPRGAIGASVEDERVRPPRESGTLLHLAVLRHAGPGIDELLLTHDLGRLLATGALRPPPGCKPLAGHGRPWNSGGDARFFNTGLVVLDRSHLCLLTSPEEPLDFVILWDQGLLNARRRLAGIGLHDLGLRFNWLGSFNSSNAHRRPCAAEDAFAVHATTGLPGFGAGRAAFLGELDATWAAKGL